MLSAVTEN